MRKKSQKTTDPAGGDFLSGNLNYLDEVKDVKITKRRRSLKPVLVMLLMVTGLAGGVIMVMIDAANRPVEEVATDELESNTIDAQTRLNINLGAELSKEFGLFYYTTIVKSIIFCRYIRRDYARAHFSFRIPPNFFL